MDKNIINWLLSILGALAWLAPWFYGFFRNPKLKCKLLSHYSNICSLEDKSFSMHFISLNLISLRKNFQIDEVEINLKYKGESGYNKGLIFWNGDKEWLINGKKFKLNIQPEDILPFVSILPKDINKNVYVTFRVENEEVEEVDEIELVLVEYTGRIHRLKINFEKLNPELMVWDCRIWSVA